MGKTYKGKAKVKAKIQQAKRKIARKVKGMAAVIALLGLVWAIEGCMETQPASRATTATYGDVVIKLSEKCSHNSVRITLGDGALASADSSGSTETQTATPSMSIPVRVDARYNDAIAGATSASKGLLDTLTDAGAAKVLSLMASGGSGTVQAEKKDGTTATIKCDGGQCYPCTDGSCTP